MLVRAILDFLTIDVIQRAYSANLLRISPLLPPRVHDEVIDRDDSELRHWPLVKGHRGLPSQLHRFSYEAVEAVITLEPIVLRIDLCPLYH